MTRAQEVRSGDHNCGGIGLMTLVTTIEGQCYARGSDVVVLV